MSAGLFLCLVLFGLCTFCIAVCLLTDDTPLDVHVKRALEDYADFDIPKLWRGDEGGEP